MSRLLLSTDSESICWKDDPGERGEAAVAGGGSADTTSHVSPWRSRERLRRNLDVRFGFVGECLRGYAWKNCSTDECQCRNGNRNAALDLLSMSHGRTSLMVRRA